MDERVAPGAGGEDGNARTRPRRAYGAFGRGTAIERYGFDTDDAADPVLREHRIYDPRYRRLSARPFRCTLVGVGRRGLHFELESFEGDVHGEVHQPEDVLVASLPMATGASRVLGTPLVEHPMLVGPGLHWTGATPGGVTFVAVDFEGTVLQRMMAAAGVERGACRWLQPAMTPVEGPAGAMLMTLFQDLAEVLLDAPDRLVDPSVFAMLEWDFTGVVQQVLADDTPDAMARSARTARNALADAARAWLEARSRSDAPPSALGDICSDLHTTERTLQAVFAEQFGVGFREMERTFRLQAAHEAILAADGASSVTDIATRYGFWHLGRFSAYYKAMFGRLPSAAWRAARSD